MCSARVGRLTHQRHALIIARTNRGLGKNRITSRRAMGSLAGCLMFALILAAGAPLSASSGTQHGRVLQASPSSCVPANRPTPTVLCVSPTQARLGDMVTVTVDNLAKLVAANGDGCANLVLFLNGFPIQGVSPARCDPDDGHAGFHLVRNAGNSEAWNSLLGRPDSLQKNVTVAVGPSSTRSIPQALRGHSEQNVVLQLEVIPKAQFWVFTLVAVALIVALVMLGRRTALLRESGGDPTRPGHKRPYSLGRTQQAFWVALVVLAYVFVYLVTSNLDSLTSSSLLLIAISSGTALGGQLMARGQKDSLAQKLAKLQANRAEAAANLDKLTASGADGSAVKVAKDTLAALDGQVAAALAALAKDDSKGFLADLVYDQDGVSLQRLQIVVWTVVLGGIFVNQVYVGLTMPEFSATLLTLMGLSSGTFLAGKSQELHQQQLPAVTSSTAPADADIATEQTAPAAASTT